MSAVANALGVSRQHLSSAKRKAPARRRGRPVLPQDAEWDALAAHFNLLPGTRQIFEIAVDQVQTSCGWGVPVMAVERERQRRRPGGRERDHARS